MLGARALFDLTHSIAGEYLESFAYPWQALEGLKEWLMATGEGLNREEFMQTAPDVWIHYTACIADTARIIGPCIIGARTELRHCAFLRGGVLVGEDCVVGNSVEVKNAILFDRVQVPHYNYVGDSILGYGAHMGAGAVTSNVKSDRSPVVIHDTVPIPTGRKKLGAMIGDHGEIGCNGVLNPGTVIGRASHIYPLSSVRGVIPANSIYKGQGKVIPKEQTGFSDKKG